MSGNGAQVPEVHLVGTSMLVLVHAIPEIERRTDKPATVIGGLAVICRLGGGYRATSDLDTVNRRTADEPAQLEVLIRSGATPTDAAGVMIPTPVGEVKVDVLEVTDWDLRPLPVIPPTGCTCWRTLGRQTLRHR